MSVATPLRAARRRRSLVKRSSLTVLEHGIQCGLFAWRELAKAAHPVLELLHAVPNGAGLNHTVRRRRDGSTTRFSAEGQKLKREGLTAGIPDVCLPAARGPHHGLYIEHKTKTGPVSDEQREKIAMLLAEGYAVIVSRDARVSIETVMAYLALGPFDARTAGLAPPTLPKKRRRASPAG